MNFADRDAQRPLPQMARHNLHDELVLRRTHLSNRIEGNPGVGLTMAGRQ